MKRLATLAALAVTLLAGCAKEVYIADICYDEHRLMTITNKSDAPVVCFTPERANLPAPGKDGGLPAVLSERERKSAIAVPAKSVARITIVEDGEPDIFEEYGVDDVCLSTLAIVDRDGVRGKIVNPLTDEEIAKLQRSADKLKSVIAQIDI